MPLTERQKLILNRLVGKYITLARPISSRMLFMEDFGVCAATIRNELQRLTRAGYLYQPHPYSGRIPSDKAYRFSVNELFKSNFKKIDQKFFAKELKKIKKCNHDIYKLMQVFTKGLATASSSLAVSYLYKTDLVWKEGWKEIFQEPEFRNFSYSQQFIQMVEMLEGRIKKISLDSSCNLKVYIGKENPILKSDEFSMMISRWFFSSRKQKGISILVGPKRMTYHKNIRLINSLVKLLEQC